MNTQAKSQITKRNSEDLKIVVLQPGYLPWLGFFNQLFNSDVFVFYDDVQFDKHGWRNRNRIKAPNKLHWLTVPVFHTGQSKPRILEVEIDNRSPWARKHIKSIQQFYAKAPFLKHYLPELEDLLLRPWELLIDLDLAIIELMCTWLGLQRHTVQSSKLNIQSRGSERLLDLCKYFHSNCYLTGNAAENYLDIDLFTDNGVQVEWHNYQHPQYPQQHGEFIPYLSALDLILNCGDQSLSIINNSK